MHISGQYHDELFQATIHCPVQYAEENMDMDPGLIHFWNLIYALMILTAISGNWAVLYIVISKNFCHFVKFCLVVSIYSLR